MARTSKKKEHKNVYEKKYINNNLELCNFQDC